MPRVRCCSGLHCCWSCSRSSRSTNSTQCCCSCCLFRPHSCCGHSSAGKVGSAAKADLRCSTYSCSECLRLRPGFLSPSYSSAATPESRYQEGLGFTALQSGLGVTAFALGSVVGASVAGRLVQRIGRPLVIGAVSLFFLATLAISLVTHLNGAHTSPVSVILPLALPVFLLGLAGGSIVTPNQTLTLADVDPRSGGTAGGVLQTAQRVGSATGQTVLGTLFFVTVAGTMESTREGTPAAHPAQFTTGLDVGLAGSLVFPARRSCSESSTCGERIDGMRRTAPDST
jgi:hypothetical protein